MPAATKERQLAAVHPIEAKHPIVTSLPDTVVARYRKRVERGATQIDGIRPGWWRHIRIKQLDMAVGEFWGGAGPSDCGCIGAQLAAHYEPEEDTGYYGNWLNYLEHKIMRVFRSRNEVAHGYTISTTEVKRGRGRDAWDLLDQLWANEVRIRRDR